MRPMGTHENLRDQWRPTETHETQGDYWSLMRPMTTHETQETTGKS